MARTLLKLPLLTVILSMAPQAAAQDAPPIAPEGDGPADTAEAEPAEEPEPEPEPAPAPEPEPEPEPAPAPEPEPEPALPVHVGVVLAPTGEPVGGAIVSIPGLELKLTTDEDGEFELAALAGSYLLRVEAAGLSPLEEEIDLDEGTELGGFELFMEMPMGDVVVTGTMTEKLAEQAPVRTQVVGREQIERRQATNLAESLDATTGIRVEGNCQNCNFTQVRLNGLEGRYTQILIDGNPVFSSLAGVYGLEQIPQEMIERVEIVKGGASALYGAGAVGGVINVITARPLRNFAGFQLRGGLVGMEEPELRLGANAGVVNEERSLALHVFGGAAAREPWDANNDGFSEIGRLRQVMTGTEAYIDVPGDGELQLKFHVLQEKRRGGDAFDRIEHDAAIAESTHTMRYGGELRFRQFVAAGFNYELGYGFAYTERDSYYGVGGDVVLDDPPTAAQWEIKQAALGAYGKTKNPVHTANALMNFAYRGLGDQIVTIGGQFVADGIDDFFPGYGRRVDEVYWNLGGIAQHNWIFNEHAESVVGVRLDQHSELDDPVASPRLALMLRPLDWLRTRSAFAMGFRAPQVFDEDLHISIVGGEAQVVYNDPDLGPERSYSLAQQFELAFPLEDGWRLTASLGGFWTRLTDSFLVVDDDDPATTGEMEMLRVNAGDTTVFGAEIEAGVTLERKWGLSGGLTLQRAVTEDEHPDFPTRDVLRTPGVYGFVETWTSPFGGLEISTMLDITGPMRVPHFAGWIAEDTLEESPWFFDWSANLSYRFELGGDRYLTPFAGVRNILDSRQTDYDRGPERDAGYVYGPRLPRTVFVGLKGGI